LRRVDKPTRRERVETMRPGVNGLNFAPRVDKATGTAAKFDLAVPEEISTMENMWQLFADQLQDRVSGPMKFRIVLQPIMATYFAMRSGLRDAKSGKDPYFWSFLIGRGHRFDIVKQGWEDIGRVVLLAGGLDLVYQFFVQSSIHLRAAVIVAFVLAVVPYVIVRGIVTRIATALKPRTGHT
jgi:hypothetical protein